MIPLVNGEGDEEGVKKQLPFSPKNIEFSALT